MSNFVSEWSFLNPGFEKFDKPLQTKSRKYAMSSRFLDSNNVKWIIQIGQLKQVFFSLKGYYDIPARRTYGEPELMLYSFLLNMLIK